MASETKTTEGFSYCCPFCTDEEAVSIGLSDMECYCNNCDENFTPEMGRDKAAKTLAAWEKICRWVEIGRQIASE